MLLLLLLLPVALLKNGKQIICLYRVGKSRSIRHICVHGVVGAIKAAQGHAYKCVLLGIYNQVDR